MSLRIAAVAVYVITVILMLLLSRDARRPAHNALMPPRPDWWGHLLIWFPVLNTVTLIVVFVMVLTEKKR